MGHKKVISGSSDRSKPFNKPTVIALKTKKSSEILHVFRDGPGLSRLSFTWIDVYALLGDDMTKVDNSVLKELGLGTIQFQIMLLQTGRDSLEPLQVFFKGG